MALSRLRQRLHAVTDRAFWEKKASQTSMEIADRLLSLIFGAQVSYQKHSWGVSTTGKQFAYLPPRKGNHLHATLSVGEGATDP